MLNSIFEKLLSPIKISKTSATTPAKKHLVIQTVYSSANSNSMDISKDVQSSSDIANNTLLDKQKEILLNQNQYKYSSIEQVTLDGKTFLIGLTKHSQPILRGIFMFPDSIQYTDEWNIMKNQASSLNAGIAIFQTRHDVTCLRLKQDNAGCCSYLVDHRAISRIEWLWHSSNN